MLTAADKPSWICHRRRCAIAAIVALACAGGVPGNQAAAEEAPAISQGHRPTADWPLAEAPSTQARSAGVKPAVFQPRSEIEPARFSADPAVRPIAQRQPLPLGPRSASAPPAGRLSSDQRLAAAPPGGSWVTIVASLLLVVGLFLAVAWLLRRGMPHSARPLPAEVVEVLGRAPLAGRQHLHLVRFGNKLVLLSVTQAGAEAVSELTDPLEVDRIAGLCQQTHAASATAAFRQALRQWSSAPSRAADRPEEGGDE
jgi:flagellar protein FliO/FliZ